MRNRGPASRLARRSTTHMVFSLMPVTGFDPWAYRLHRPSTARPDHMSAYSRCGLAVIHGVVRKKLRTGFGGGSTTGDGHAAAAATISPRPTMDPAYRP